MASRGKKTVAGPSRGQRDAEGRNAVKPTFVSPAAAERYKKSIVGKKCIQERGFINPIKGFRLSIRDRGWEEFAKQPEAAVVPVVREFYANAKEHDNYKALVRGKLVAFDSKTINRKYGLPDIEEDDYSQLKEDGADYEDIIEFLAKPGTKWKTSKDVVLSFPASGLQIGSKAWHYFISAKLMPSYHVSSVHRDRAVLNFAIQKGLSIDVGKVIHSSILTMMSGVTRGGGFGHPSLIYALCVQAGVEASASEEIQHPKPGITPDMIRKLDKGEASSAEEGEDPAAPSTSTAATKKRKQKKQTTDQSSQQEAILNELKQEVTEVKKISKAINRRLDQMFSRQEQQYNYLIQIYTAAAQAGTMEQLPPPPVFQPISPAQTPEREIEEETESESEQSNW